MRYNVENLPHRTTKDGTELDVFSRKARRAVIWGRGEVGKVKTRARRRDRHMTHQVLRAERY